MFYHYIYNSSKDLRKTEITLVKSKIKIDFIATVLNCIVNFKILYLKFKKIQIVQVFICKEEIIKSIIINVL